MPPRKVVPNQIWELPVTWTVTEIKEYIQSSESKQDSLDVNKYLKTRGNVETTMYEQIVSIQKNVNPKKDKFPLIQFIKLFMAMKKRDPNNIHLKLRTHLVRRSDKMMKIFLEDFKDDVQQTLEEFHFFFDGNNWNSAFKIEETNVLQANTHGSFKKSTRLKHPPKNKKLKKQQNKHENYFTDPLFNNISRNNNHDNNVEILDMNNVNAKYQVNTHNLSIDIKNLNVCKSQKKMESASTQTMNSNSDTNNVNGQNDKSDNEPIFKVWMDDDSSQNERDFPGSEFNADDFFEINSDTGNDSTLSPCL
ncbi:hypothetical protein TRFO_14007 [Tritrichomonas foetus]|uniref:SPK domain-containing protein n=1 Tax=Tritrichomonas foetus TaxID=1144522 RepID=A0A1J4L178_9EUKA|nr:hypothetical protein TRFO_14007 [Tritrichomonas foetus]|eukprot:OHT15637.1 hypothetical protein TRFO_14007 [Tritrichomonas foetus]